MKKVKLVFLLLVMGLIVLVGYQNLGFLVVRHQFGVNLGFVNYQAPEISNLVLLLGFFLAGLLLALLLSIRGRWRSRRMIKEMTGEVASSREKITALENELAGLKAAPQILEAANGDAEDGVVS